MANLFASAGKINTRFDLKGSIIGRSTPEDQDDTVARKDLDFNQAGLMIARPGEGEITYRSDRK
jgi:hypothetical protein